MKRLIKTVNLSFFCDDANGEYGLAHTDTIDNNYGNAFNAFWGGMGIFHDVFEHSHEYQNKYFRGDYAMNVGGEMAAMGAMWYYIDVLGVYNRLNNRSMYSPGDVMRLGTQDMVHESITDGYTSFGNTLESNVPKQRPTENGELEYQIEKFWKDVKALTVKTEYEQERESGKEYKKSLSFRKIADLHRYGFRMAERLVPDNRDNATTLVDFFEVWEQFCKANEAETMARMFKGVSIKLYKENDRISWKAEFKTADRMSFKNVTLTAETIARFSEEDAWISEDENY
jgi:hypothetical protein